MGKYGAKVYWGVELSTLIVAGQNEKWTPFRPINFHDTRDEAREDKRSWDDLEIDVKTKIGKYIKIGGSR